MLFSVIVPIYKVENYLEACIESVLNQTFDDFELILVDDGSPDRCPEICDEYEKKDPRIRVIHKKNGGLADARQAGARIAQGEYVYNLDSDDLIEKDTLLCASKIIKSTGSEIVSFGYRWMENSVEVALTDDGLEEGFYDREAIEKYIYPKLMMDKNMEHISYYLAGKAIKRELALPNQLAVNPSISLGEDLCCVVPCYMQAQSVYISKEAKYLYTKRTDSMSKEFNTDQIFLVENVIKEVCKTKLKKPDDFEHQLNRYSCFMCFAILAAAACGNKLKNAEQIKKNIRDSIHYTKIRNARFDKITPKSRITVFLMKKGLYKTAFCFLHICEKIKRKG